MARVMEITTPLGEDVLLFHRMQAREEMSRLFEYRLDLLSTRGDIDLDEILGKNVTLRVGLTDEGPRYFNGYVTRFAHSGTFGRYHRYVAVVRPWLWLLTRTADCRIFQDMTVPDIAKAVFGDHTAADVSFELTSSYRTWKYCVQYRETDFNFVSRLLEHEGIYYYFRHTNGHDTMVLTDSTSMHEASSGGQAVRFIPPGQLVRPGIEHISHWEFSREIQPSVYVHDDYDLERPRVELRTRRALSRNVAPSPYEIYDYPGHYLQTSDGEQYAEIRIDEYGSQFETAIGETNARGVSVGSLFTMDRHPRADQNREHVVVAANYDLEFSEYEAMPEGGGVDYRCSFTAMSSRQQFRPRRLTPKPFMQGPQTAVVVGPAGEEIHTDKHARVKVQFHWDRYGKNDQHSSCWIRVSHPWAGKGWGTIATPRIGQEVIVDFLDGDPDRPIITGRVYNAEQTPPWTYPAGAVVSGTKSDTHQGFGYNEISLDDTAGAEKITVHAQSDMHTTVEHDQTTTVHNDRTDQIGGDDAETVGGNQRLAVLGHRTAAVGGNDTTAIAGHRTESVGGNQAVSIGGHSTDVVGGNSTDIIGGNETRTIAGSVSETIGGALTQTIGSAFTQTIAGALTQTASGDVTVTTPGQCHITANGGTKIITPGGCKVIAPGGHTQVDSFWDQHGGTQHTRFGEQLQLAGVVGSHFGLRYTLRGVDLRSTGFKFDTVGVLMEKRGLETKNGGVTLRTFGLNFLCAGFHSFS